MVVLSFTIKCRIIQRARVHKSLYILVAGPPSLHTHFSVWDMAREGEPKITFCAFSLRTRLRARRFAAVALSSAGVTGFSADVAVGFVMIGRLTQLWNCRVLTYRIIYVKSYRKIKNMTDKRGSVCKRTAYLYTNISY